MNEKALTALRAIDKAISRIDDKETRDLIQKARNYVELLGTQCDRAEERRAYWVKEAVKVMRCLDVVRNEQARVVYVSRDLPKF